MPKLKNPFMAFGASGSIGKHLTVRNSPSGPVLEEKPIPKDAKTSTQLAWRTMYQACTVLWHQLSDLEKQQWESNARPLHMTGYAWFMSQCLRPNPGIYLPLAGGTMQGNIDMDSNRITNLPAPVADEEPLRKVDFGSEITSWTAGKYLLGDGAGNPPLEVSGWQKISELVVSSDCDYVDFTSLDINTDLFYRFFLHLKNAATGLSLYFLFRNGDYTLANYDSQYCGAYDSGLSASRYSYPIFGYINSSEELFATILISKTTSNIMVAIAETMLNPSTSSIQAHYHICSINTTSNITSLRLSAISTNGIGQGSTFLLCKMRTS